MTFAHVVCEQHPHAQRPGWIVCEHVLDARVPALIEAGGKRTLNEMLCATCRLEHQALSRLRLMCPECVDELLRMREEP